MKAVRSILYAVWLYGSMAVIGLAGMPAAAFSRRFAVGVMHAWTRAALAGLPIAGIKVRLLDRDRAPGDGPVLVASKHQAMLDVIVLQQTFRDPIFIMKRELMKMPVFGWYMKRTGQIAVDRESGGAALKTMVRSAAVHAAAGRQIIIFPEGTRKRPGEATDYKPGVAALYRELGVACAPVSLDTGQCWPASGIMMTPGVATVRFLEPIAPGLDRRTFMAQLEAQIEGAPSRGAAP
jgi:1-acyl-sn-glycerol-3-phosphate acyltransferase